MRNIIALTLVLGLVACTENDNQSSDITTDVSNEIELNQETLSSDSNIEREINNEEINTKIDSSIQASVEQSLDEKMGAQKTELSKVNFHEYIEYGSFLKKHVSPSGKVNYSSAKSDPNLEIIIAAFQANTPSAEWSKNEKLAYWINAYNLFTIKLVTTKYPISSIKDITTKPWDKSFIELGGSTMSLNDIEHKEIRAKYNEPRIHFALNCASESCPILSNKAYLPQSLNTQLSRATKNFLSDISKNDLSNSSDIKISQLFDWYKTDFNKDGDVTIFINKYIQTPLDNPTISYLDYSWKLNN